MRASEIASVLGVTARTVCTPLAALTGRRPHAAPQHEHGPLLRVEPVPGVAGRGGRRYVFLTGSTTPG
ncbi:hypothetical protein ABZ383_14650 [Streptomyces sp. NPDC005900]|uniref:hypothetical protein n=1 Tax=Streptomyces sp. NPDC005900 TaxID=3154569 RepID=UPI0033CFC715